MKLSDGIGAIQVSNVFPVSRFIGLALIPLPIDIESVIFSQNNKRDHDSKMPEITQKAPSQIL